jgi:hypothetical protein
MHGETVKYNKDSCVDISIDLFIHIADTQWDVTHTTSSITGKHTLCKLKKGHGWEFQETKH